eukprot:CAMPEP_0194161152 /NCGR_PEP_ID=MMETSP0152-20130528/78782_1 /TAXON_ID=1049557 /ORGANISM="Thalassiothrix antarctica, Strain L6-D1" /LENGTH=521 /DNA_ID=CAMNT_0038870909 /DNA_START=46 /DNA_END=1609 /DNA_ORIENTATION=-
MTSESPSVSIASWTVYDVEAWAESVGLSSSTISNLVENEVDGPTLITLNKTDLKSELDIKSLPARRYLWDVIQNLKFEQENSDYYVAIQSPIITADEASGGTSKKETTQSSHIEDHALVVEYLRTDAQHQRQIIEDHLFALSQQRIVGEQSYEDTAIALKEQTRLDELFNQSECDRTYALSLATPRERNQAENIDRARRQDDTLMTNLSNLCVNTCARNKISNAEVLLEHKGKTQNTIINKNIPTLILSDDDESEDGKPKAKPALDNLPMLHQCNVCYQEQVRGYTLACNHLQCIKCMKKLFQTALGDRALLPLKCCDIPIDMNIARDLLDEKEFDRIFLQVEEIFAKNKMYCPSCQIFINLDLVDTTQSTDLPCMGCGTLLCVSCQTLSHPGTSCKENKAIMTGDDELLLDLSKQEGWKQCPSCSILIELRSGCNHITCQNCTEEFCYRCLKPWSKDNGMCSSGECEVWDEDRLVEAGEARVQQLEAARGGRIFPERIRQERMARAVAALRANETCQHEW